MEHEDDEARPLEDHMIGTPDGERGLLFGGGVAFGAALLAIVWVVVSVLSGGDPDPSPGAARADIGSPLAGAAVPAPPSQEERCEQAMYALRAPLRAAQPAMDQWEVHIGAMNKLVVGAITLRQATAFWNQTRVGAERRIAGFRKSMRTLRRTGVDCPSIAMLPATATPALRACVGRVAADMRAVRAATTAIGTWQMHVGDMERLRAGTLSPGDASRMWVAMWQRGQRELTSYRAATRDARRAGSCDGASTGSEAAQPSASPTASPSMDMPGMG